MSVCFCVVRACVRACVRVCDLFVCFVFVGGALADVL